MSQGFVYTMHMNGVSVSTVNPMVQVKAGAAALQLIRAWVSQSSTTTSTQVRVGIVRMSAAATVTSVNPYELNTNGPASLAVGSTSGTGHTGTTTGTDGDILYPDAFNILNGWVWIPTPEERIVVPQTGIIALKFLAAPTAITVSAGLVWEEWI